MKMMPALSSSSSRVYEAGPWYVKVNHGSRRAFVTSGDMWFNVTRAEAARLLRDAR